MKPDYVDMYIDRRQLAIDDIFVTDPESRHNDGVRFNDENDADHKDPPFQAQHPLVQEREIKRHNIVHKPSDIFDDSVHLERHVDGPRSSSLVDDDEIEVEKAIATRYNNDPTQRNVDIAPSDGQVFVPSLTPPTTTPTLAPTMTSSPTPIPSLDPRNGSILPSSMPSDVSDIKCIADDDGYFGKMGGTSSVIHYFYEMEYDADGVVSSLFKAVEKAVADTMIPVLLPDLCGTPNSTRPGIDSNGNTTDSMGNNSTENISGDANGMGNRMRMLAKRRRLEAIGSSPRPDEMVLPNMACVVPKKNRTNICIVSDGSFTLFLDSPESGERTTSLNAIQDAMKAGRFNNIHESIVRISYLQSVTTITPTSAPIVATDKSGSSSTTGLPIWAYILIGLGGLLLIGIIVFIWRRRATTKSEKEETQTRVDPDYRDNLGDDEDNDSYEPPDGAVRDDDDEEASYRL